MILQKTESIFDTLVDTNKIYVSMKTSFVLRAYKDREGNSPVYLFITSGKTRERINLDLRVDARLWNSKQQRLALLKETQDANLILDNIQSKLTSIKTAYRLAERVLTPELLRKELTNNMPRVKFTSFFSLMLEEEKINLEPGTYRRHKAVVAKIKAYDDEVTFLDLDEQWITKYRNYLKKLGNQETTINSNVASIKKFLKIATKNGIKIKLNLDEIVVGSTTGNRTSLTTSELKICLKYYFSEFINESYSLVLGYFLFSCMTGMRLSDVLNLNRKSLVDNHATFIARKTKKDQSIALNEIAKKIIDHDPYLFEKKFTGEHLNGELKKIMKSLKIHKHVTFHVGRHTFATSFLRAGGRVEKLQILLGHSKITDTMIYSHIVASEANKEIFLLDELLT